MLYKAIIAVSISIQNIQKQYEGGMGNFFNVKPGGTEKIASLEKDKI
jgi:hypothetical protein